MLHVSSIAQLESNSYCLLIILLFSFVSHIFIFLPLSYVFHMANVV